LAVVDTEETVTNRREATNRQDIDAKMFPIMAVAVLN
jgi:hypothetical protein